MTAEELELLDVGKTFSKQGAFIKAIEKVTFSVAGGEFVCILGPSGCGKSTLLRMMAGLTRPDTGVVKFQGSVLSGPHPKISMVFQNFALLPWKRVIENVELGLKIRGKPAHERRRIARGLIEKVGLHGFEHSYPVELSGGMKQRVGLARALATDPDAILLDEPFSALDEFTASTLRREVLRIWRENEQMFVMVTHSIHEALELANKIVILSSRPATVKELIDIEIPWPRNATQGAFTKYEKRIFSLLREELSELYDMEKGYGDLDDSKAIPKAT